jgi:hydroxymethylpyrimidine kinase/phosphomethylpyrimidine kinase
MKYILVIAGSDSCGGAGIQADTKTITALGAHSLVVVSAVTAQNSMGIKAIHQIPAGFISEQLAAVMEDVVPDGIKIGMLYSKGAVEAVVKFLRQYPLSNIVLDPLIKSTTGDLLIESDAISVIKEHLLPIVDVVTPNLNEAAVFTEMKIENKGDMIAAAKRIREMGPDTVVTGGHLKGSCIDILNNGKTHQFAGARIETEHTHGSGCVFSAALATFLAHGKDMFHATKLAHDFTRCAIINGYPCGRGSGPVYSGFKKNENDKDLRFME